MMYFNFFVFKKNRYPCFRLLQSEQRSYYIRAPKMYQIITIRRMQGTSLLQRIKISWKRNWGKYVVPLYPCVLLTVVFPFTFPLETILLEKSWAVKDWCVLANRDIHHHLSVSTNPRWTQPTPRCLHFAATCCQGSLCSTHKDACFRRSQVSMCWNTVPILMKLVC